MAVHVDEIHTQVSASASAHGAGPPGRPEQGDAAATGPGAHEDLWRGAEARVHQLRCRVAAEGFDD